MSEIKKYATLANLIIELTDIPYDKKHNIKEIIDISAESAEKLANKKDNCIWSDKDRISAIASKHNIKKIVEFAIYSKSGAFVPMLKIYGENYESFAKEAGIVLVDGYVAENGIQIIDEFEEKYGKIIYEKR